MQPPDYMHEEKKAFGLIVSENAWIINVQKCKSEAITVFTMRRLNNIFLNEKKKLIKLEHLKVDG